MLLGLVVQPHTTDLRVIACEVGQGARETVRAAQADHRGALGREIPLQPLSDVLDRDLVAQPLDEDQRAGFVH